jgi:hypothetical protein
MKEDKATGKKPRKTRIKKPKPPRKKTPAKPNPRWPPATARYTGGRQTVYNDHFEFEEFRELAAKPGITVLTTAVLDPFDPTIKGIHSSSNRTTSADKDRKIYVTQ